MSESDTPSTEAFSGLRSASVTPFALESAVYAATSPRGSSVAPRGREASDEAGGEVVLAWHVSKQPEKLRAAGSSGLQPLIKDNQTSQGPFQCIAAVCLSG